MRKLDRLAILGCLSVFMFTSAMIGETLAREAGPESAIPFSESNNLEPIQSQADVEGMVRQMASKECRSSGDYRRYEYYVSSGVERTYTFYFSCVSGTYDSDVSYLGVVLSNGGFAFQRVEETTTVVIR